MKSNVLTAAVFALALSASPSLAIGPTWLGVNGGVNVPTGDFGDFASLGFFGGATGTWMLNEKVGFGGDINFHSFGVNDEAEEDLAAAAGESVDITLSALQITPHVKFFFSSGSGFLPYAKLGAGIYNTKFKVETDAPGFSEESSDSNMGINLGVGGMVKSSETMAYGIELLYHTIMSEGESSNLFTIGGVLNFGFGN